MGYSCTKDAADSLAVVQHIFGKTGWSGVFVFDYAEYFFERGRENADGAITGTLMRMLPDDMCRKAGNVRIEPNGQVTRFPGMTKCDREEVFNTFLDMRARNPQLLSAWGYPSAI